MEEEDITVGLKVVTFGGGNGHKQNLLALKMMKMVEEITAGCPGTDNGKSTGELCDFYGLHTSLGDTNRCYAALTPYPYVAQGLLNRPATGPFKGHPGGNALLTYLLTAGGTLEQSLEAMRQMCGLGKHRVFPVTGERTTLVATLPNGKKIKGESAIDKLADNELWDASLHGIVNIELEPEVPALPAFIRAIEEADWIIICPGDFYTSIISTLLPLGIREALARARARIIYIMPLMTKRGETDGYTFETFRDKIQPYLGDRAADFIIVNSAPISKKALKAYENEHKRPPVLVTTDQDFTIQSRVMMETPEGHLCHDPDLLASELEMIFKKNSPVLVS
ncbi:MAG: YvcK family protein [Candidatus Pacebacteria bacterium]|nr:YvcK family protein [Candidatus Paceibacterota bacterium]